MSVAALRYLIWEGEPDLRVRYGGVIAVLFDTVTTLYLLYFSGLPVGEFNPLGMLVYEGFIGEAVFMAVPLFNVLLLVSLPGLLGDAVGLSNVFVHLFATAINTSHLLGMPLEEAVGVSAGTAYIFAVTAGTGVGVMYYLPELLERWRAFQRDR